MFKNGSRTTRPNVALCGWKEPGTKNFSKLVSDVFINPYCAAKSAVGYHVALCSPRARICLAAADSSAASTAELDFTACSNAASSGSFSINLGIESFTVLIDFAARPVSCDRRVRSEEHTSELQSRGHLVCRLLL